MKTVVFGGTGFIGSHVAEQLEISGHEVTAIVRSSSDTQFLSTLGLNILPLALDNARNIACVSSEKISCWSATLQRS